MAKNKLFLIATAILFLPIFTQASTLYMDPVESQYGPGDSFPIDVKISVEGICINTIEAEIGFPKANMRFVDFIIGDSIINLWVDRPGLENIAQINSSGRIHFAGGIPGGYCGKIPGDPGESNIIGRLIFKIPGLIIGNENLESVSIDFMPATRVLLNDGLGTADGLTTNSAVIKILDMPATDEVNWRQQINDDKIPPAPFIVELHSNPNVYNGEYYIDFFTTDKQSGMDHYEVLELRPDEEIGEKPRRSLLDYLFPRKKTPLDWKPGEIPYLLSDQELKSVISVKAVDKAGNERLVEFVPPPSERTKAQLPGEKINFLILLITGGLSLVLTGLMLAWKVSGRRKSPPLNIDN